MSFDPLLVLQLLRVFAGILNMLLSKTPRKIFHCFLVFKGLKHKTLNSHFHVHPSKKCGLTFFSLPFSLPYLSLPLISGIGSVLLIHMAASLIALVQGIRYCAFWCQVQSQVPIYEPVYKKNKNKKTGVRRKDSIVNRFCTTS